MATGTGTVADPRVFTMATETANGIVDNEALIQELLDDATAGSLVTSNVATDVTADTVSIGFTTTPSGAQITAIDAVALAHTGVALAGPTMEVSATGTITTTSGTDVVATSMTLTPPSGTYLVMFSGARNTNQNDASQVSIWAAGAQVPESERRGQARDHEDAFVSVARVTVNGSQAIEGRWRTSGNQQITMWERQLTLVKV